MYIDYGCHRGLGVDELLQHEITSTELFLMDKGGFLKKSIKSQLATELLKLCPHIDQQGSESSPQTYAVVIDFMAFERKIPLKKLHPPVQTFHDFANVLTCMITKAGHNSAAIHIVFDSHREDSIRHEEMEKRTKSKEMIVLDVISSNKKNSSIIR